MLLWFQELPNTLVDWFRTVMLCPVTTMRNTTVCVCVHVCVCMCVCVCVWVGEVNCYYKSIYMYSKCLIANNAWAIEEAKNGTSFHHNNYLWGLGLAKYWGNIKILIECNASSLLVRTIIILKRQLTKALFR